MFNLLYLCKGSFPWFDEKLTKSNKNNIAGFVKHQVAKKEDIEAAK